MKRWDAFALESRRLEKAPPINFNVKIFVAGHSLSYQLTGKVKFPSLMVRTLTNKYSDMFFTFHPYYSYKFHTQ